MTGPKRIAQGAALTASLGLAAPAGAAEVLPDVAPRMPDLALAEDGPTKAAPETAAAAGPLGGSTGLFLLGGLAFGALALGGGGGGGGADAAPADDTSGISGDLPLALEPEPGPVLPETPEGFRTTEFSTNYGLGLIGAEYRYALGATGGGTLGAMLDTGADLSHPELAGVVDEALSFSYYEGEGAGVVTDRDGHGTHVLGIMGAARDGSGMHGLAFDADYMVLKGFGDADGTRSSEYPSVFGDALLRAAEAGATVLNNSWSYVDPDGGPYLITDFADRAALEAHLGGITVDALETAAAADLVTVFATANDAAGEVSSTAGLPLLMPEYAGLWLAVTSVDAGGDLAASANACGTAAAFCLAAPGVAVPGPEAGTDDLTLRSGTSMAAPHVSGAVLVLKSQFPELTGSEITAILLESATDLGDPGTDAVYGHGLLNLAGAMEPSGAVVLETGTTVGAGEAPLASSGVVESAAMAGVVAAALGERTALVTDGWDRGYALRMADDRAERLAADDDAVTVTLGPQTLTLGTRAVAPAGLADPVTFAAPYDAFAGDEVAFSWEGRVARGLGLTFGATGSEAGRLLSVGVDVGEGPLGVTFEMGRLQETETVLGSRFEGGLGGGAGAETRYARLGGRLVLEGGYTLHASASLGVSAFEGSGVLGRGDVTSRAVSLGATRQRGGTTWSLGVARPLAVTGGQIEMSRGVAITPSEDGMRTNSILSVDETVEMGGADVPYELQMGLERPLAGGAAELGALLAIDRDEPDVAMSAGWRLRF